MESGNNKEFFDRQIKAKLDEFQPEVPASLWNAIEKELPREEKLTKISDKPRLPYSWAAIAACLLIVFSFWKLQPEEVIHLRATAALAEKPAATIAGKADHFAEPARVSTPAPSASYTASVDEPITAHSEKSAPDRLAAVPLNSYTAIHQTETESHRPIKVREIPEPDFINDPEVKSVLEEGVAFAPAVQEETSAADLPEQDAHALSGEERSRPKVVSSVLNFIASNIQIGGGGTRIEFSETEHGVLKVDIKGFLNKNNQGL